MADAPVRLVLALHLHQPVGQLAEVHDRHLAEVYAPLLEAIATLPLGPVALHVSGPLLEWHEAHAPAWLDRLGRLVADGRVELLAAGHDEPILAMLPRADRQEQLARQREWLRRRFGVEADVAWLTERVWEPDLAADLAAAGLRAVLVDDRHFLAAGLAREALHRPWVTEHDGRALRLLPMHEPLRHLVPFRPPSEFADAIRALRAAGQPLAVMADDGEKLGGWPGTRQWVYDDGWLRDFGTMLRQLEDEGACRLVTCAQALAEVPAAGPAYLPSATYREMERWALPPEGQRRLAALEGRAATAPGGADEALVRGTHWRHFLVRYPEANRLHKAMLALSALCHERGDPPAARRAIARAQCNDAYWHGVFGGLYLPHLREQAWTRLADAEALLRLGEPLACDVLDLDADGHDEAWVHSYRFSAIVSGARGLGIEVLTHFASGRNHADVLSRRHEAYHEALPAAARPPADATPRAIGVERVLAASVTLDDLLAGTAPALAGWATSPMALEVEREAGAITVRGRAADGYRKSVRFTVDGRCTLHFRWDRHLGTPADRFTTELSLAAPLVLHATPPAETWRYTVRTVAQTVGGTDTTVQGEAVLLRWPVGLGEATVELAPPAQA
ncbi:MAG: alpha-amylase/4-alpha-glucanotransferase domain-containing protein [Gemmatimonadales bacterium]|nr:alpha-amylase/4-alpha-glucanotransferase domain-containing protein [Gemmatimonadales bacterium]